MPRHAIGLGRVSVSQRLNNQLEFSQQEMFRSADVGFSRGEIPEYFFTGRKFRNTNKSEVNPMDADIKIKSTGKGCATKILLNGVECFRAWCSR